MYFKGHAIDFYLMMLKTYARPILGRNTAIFSTHTLMDVILPESVQRKFTRYLARMRNNNDHINELEILGLQFLEERRVIADFCLVFKGIHDLRELDFSYYPIF